MASQAWAQGGSHALILLVEDEVLARMASTALLEPTGFRVMPVASGEEALEVLATVPDIKAVVTSGELSSREVNGFELSRKIRTAWPLIPVLIMSGPTASKQDELPSGVYFLAKPVHGATLLHIVQHMIGSRVRFAPTQQKAEGSSAKGQAATREQQALTPRQRSVLQLLAQGKSNRDIALALGLSENTVKVHLVSVYRVLGVSSRVKAVLEATRHSQFSQLSQREDQAEPSRSYLS